MAARVDSLLEEADQLADDEQFAAALAILARLLARKTLTAPQRIHALMSRASIYDERDADGDHARALADCTAALALDKKSPDVLYLRSTIHQTGEDWRASRKDLDAAIALDPDPHGGLYESRGLARYNLGDYRGARDDFAAAFAAHDRRGDDVEARFHVYRGMAALLLEEPREAVADFTAALVRAPDDAKALAQRAKAHEACGDPRAALADLDRLHAVIEPTPLLEAERARVRALTSRSRRTRG